MATTGTLADMLARLKAVLPAGWFPITGVGETSATPVLDGILSGIAWMLAQSYALIAYVMNQTRIGTSTDIWLDLTALDYFGLSLTRNNGETDPAFSARIEANLLAPRVTRAAMISALTDLTGVAPDIFEPFNPGDTGAYGYGGLGYGVAGGYGSLALPAQAFITVYRQIEGGVPNVAGYNGNSLTAIEGFSTGAGTNVVTSSGQQIDFVVGGLKYAPGGYGVGLIEYATMAQAGTQVSDAEIYATVAATQAEGVCCWTRIK